MKEPTAKMLTYFMTTIKEYDSCMDALSANAGVNDKDVFGQIMIDATQALLIMNVAWKELTGIDIELPNSVVAKAKLEEYLEEYTGETNTNKVDFVHRLKGEPDSMLTLLGRLTDRDREVTPKLLADIAFRLQELGIDLFAMEVDLETFEHYVETTDNGIQVYTNLILMRTIRHIMNPEDSKTWNRTKPKESRKQNI